MNTVDLEHAQLLKEAGWKGETERTHFLVRIVPVRYELRETNRCLDSQLLDYPAPNISELLDHVEFEHLKTYWWSVDERSGPFEKFENWQYRTMKNPNTLARIWVWKERTRCSSLKG